MEIINLSVEDLVKDFSKAQHPNLPLKGTYFLLLFTYT